MKIKEWWLIEYIKKYGWKGLFCETFSINSDRHPFYVDGYKRGSECDIKTPDTTTEQYMRDLIWQLETNVPSFNPTRMRSICGIRGWRKAFHERFGCRA